MTRDKAIEYFQVFYETSKTILSSSSLQEILQNLVEKTVHALDVKAGGLRLINEQTNCLEQVAAYRLSDKYLNKGPLNADKSIPEVLEGKAVFVKNADKDPRIQYQKELREEGINTMLSVPVIAGDKIIGVLRCYSAVSRDFSAEEIEFVSALAEMGGLAISNAKAFEQEEDKLEALFNDMGIELPQAECDQPQELEDFVPQPVDRGRSLELFRTLHEVTRALLSSMESKQVMDLIIDKVLGIFQIKGCALRIINETTRELEMLACRGLSDRFLKKGPLHIDKSIEQTLKGQPVLVAHAQSDSRIEYPEAMVKEGIASILSLPIEARNRVIGILRLYTTAQRPFSQDEVAFLCALAEIAGIVIMNAKLYEETRHDLSFWTATKDYMDQPS